MPALRPIHHALGANIGCHPSELEGFKAARGDVALFLPADLQILPGRAARVLSAAAAGADVVRRHRVQRADVLARRWLSAANNRLERLVMGVDVHDAHSSMLVTRRAMDVIVPKVVNRAAR